MLVTAEPFGPPVIAAYDASAAVKRGFPIVLFFTIVFLGAAIWFAAARVFVANWVLGEVLLVLALIGLQWYRWLSEVRLLELTSGTLRWKSFRHGGEIPLADVRRIRPYSFSGRYLHMTDVIIDCAGRRAIRVKRVSGLLEFTALRRARPELEISVPQ
jgi:hypothetical protein